MNKLLLLGGKKLYAVGFLLLFLLAAGYFAANYLTAREKINRTHNDYKKFLYLLSRAQRGGQTLSEDYIRSVSKRLGLQLYKLEKTGNYYRVVYKNLPSTEVVPLLGEFTRAGKVVRFELQDQSGGGNFYAVFVLSQTDRE